MSDKSYFSKSRTGGSSASKGFNYQDLCVIYYLLENINVNEFEAIGVETDDDFTVIFTRRKVLLQVKCEELSISLAKPYIGKDRVLIGPSKNKSLSTLITYLNQYRGYQSSSESPSSKVSVTEDFKEVLKRNGLELGRLGIADTWSVEIIPEDKVEEVIKLKMFEWGIENQLLLDGDSCLNDLRLIVSDRRNKRGYVDKSDVTKLLEKHSKKLIIKGDVSGSINPIEPLVLGDNEIIRSVNRKISQAENLLGEQRYDEALTEYLELAKVIDSALIYIKCAEMLQITGKLDKAILYCDKALVVAPMFYRAFAVKGTLLADKGDLDFALELLLTAEYHNGEDPFVLYNVGVAYLGLKNVVKAIEYFEKTIAVDSGLSSPHLNIGVCLYNQGEFSESLKRLDMSLFLEPGLPQALSQKGEIKRFYGEVDEAIKLFERCLTTLPDNCVAKLGLALCLIEKGDILGFGLLVKLYAEDLRKLEIGGQLTVVDIGWDRTNGISIKNMNGSSYLVSYYDMEVCVFN